MVRPSGRFPCSSTFRQLSSSSVMAPVYGLASDGSNVARVVEAHLLVLGVELRAAQIAAREEHRIAGGGEHRADAPRILDGQPARRIEAVLAQLDRGALRRDEPGHEADHRHAMGTQAL